jgi:hypothetical protein
MIDQAAMADPPLLGGDDGANNTLQVATQIAIETRKALANQAHAAATMLFRTFPPTVLVDAVQALPDEDLAQFVEIARDALSPEQFLETLKSVPAFSRIVDLLNKNQGVLAIASLLVALSQCQQKESPSVTNIQNNTTIIQQAPPAAQPPTPPQRPTPPTEKI